MPIVTTYTSFEVLSEDLAKAQHNLSTASLAMALTNVAPDAATHTVLGDLTEISYTNLSSRAISGNNVSRSGPITTFTFNNLVLTASGTVPTFRYLVLYNTGNNKLIGYYDVGVAVNLIASQTFTVEVDPGGVLVVTVN